MPWRLLEEENKDVIQDGDEKWSSFIEGWESVPEVWHGRSFVEASFNPVRRRFTQEEPQQWQPIETAPIKRCVLLYAASQKDWLIGSVGPDGTVRDWDGCRSNEWDFRPTHWLPLPPAPADQLGRAVPLAEASPPRVVETENPVPLTSHAAFGIGQDPWVSVPCPECSGSPVAIDCEECGNVRTVYVRKGQEEPSNETENPPVLPPKEEESV